jgi:hypothetical protein
MQTYEDISLIEETLRSAIFESDVIFTDDIPISLQVKGNGKVKKARIRVYVRGGTGPRLTAYDFSIDRSKKRRLHVPKRRQTSSPALPGAITRRKPLAPI